MRLVGWCLVLLTLCGVMLCTLPTPVHSATQPKPLHPNTLDITPSDLGNRPVAGAHNASALFGNRMPAAPATPLPDLATHREVARAAMLSGALSSTMPRKQVTIQTTPSPHRVLDDPAGDDVASAFPITSLPFADTTRSTCAFNDDYAPPCGVYGAPDVVYAYTPSDSGCLRVSLCGSSYDTGLFIARDSITTVIGCNDDFCGISSELNGIPVLAGHTYYIVIDGFGSGCGNYHLFVENCPAPPPSLECPA